MALVSALNPTVVPFHSAISNVHHAQGSSNTLDDDLANVNLDQTTSIKISNVNTPLRPSDRIDVSSFTYSKPQRNCSFVDSNTW